MGAKKKKGLSQKLVRESLSYNVSEMGAKQRGPTAVVWFPHGVLPHNLSLIHI